MKPQENDGTIDTIARVLFRQPAAHAPSPLIGRLDLLGLREDDKVSAVLTE